MHRTQATSVWSPTEPWSDRTNCRPFCAKGNVNPGFQPHHQSLRAINCRPNNNETNRRAKRKTPPDSPTALRDKPDSDADVIILDEEEPLQEDFINLASVNSNFQFDSGHHRKKVIGMYTEKGGVGKTNFILGTVRSKIYNKILIIDTDPQNNVVNGFMSPSLIARRRDTFTTSSQFAKTGNLDKVLKIMTGPNQPTVHLVLGDRFPTDLQRLFDSEREVRSKFDYHAHDAIKYVRQALKDYDVVLIDFNPKMSLVNRILLMACDEVIQLVTGDIHSQAAIASLIKVRDEECEYFNVHAGPEDSQDKGEVSFEPQRFTITIVPSLIDRRADTLRAGHKPFVDKVFHLVKEKEQSDILFRGFIGLAQSVYGVRPVKLLKQEKFGAKENDTSIMFEDIRRVLIHCIEDTSEYMEEWENRFPWETFYEEAKAPKGLKSALYIFKHTSPNNSNDVTYKVGWSKSPGTRKKKLKSTFKKKWGFVKCWRTTIDIVRRLERKILDYFSDNNQVGETIRFDPEDSRAELFPYLLQQMDDRNFVEDFLLES